VLSFNVLAPASPLREKEIFSAFSSPANRLNNLNARRLKLTSSEISFHKRSAKSSSCRPWNRYPNAAKSVSGISRCLEKNPNKERIQRENSSLNPDLRKPKKPDSALRNSSFSMKSLSLNLSRILPKFSTTSLTLAAPPFSAASLSRNIQTSLNSSSV